MCVCVCIYHVSESVCLPDCPTGSSNWGMQNNELKWKVPFYHSSTFALPCSIPILPLLFYSDTLFSVSRHDFLLLFYRLFRVNLHTLLSLQHEIFYFAFNFHIVCFILSILMLQGMDQMKICRNIVDGSLTFPDQFNGDCKVYSPYLSCQFILFSFHVLLLII